MTEEKNADERPVVLKVDHVAKMFRLPTEQATGLKMAFLNWTKGIKGYTEQHVLRDINFEVRQGDFFGIVGRNGSGKSTLLKIISQIYTPEQGSVTVKGKLVPFIELGVGFNPELTGRENVYLNGALLGFTHAEIDAMYDDIVEFAELEDFMDQKLLVLRDSPLNAALSRIRSRAFFFRAAGCQCQYHQCNQNRCCKFLPLQFDSSMFVSAVIVPFVSDPSPKP